MKLANIVVVFLCVVVVGVVVFANQYRGQAYAYPIADLKVEVGSTTISCFHRGFVQRNNFCSRVLRAMTCEGRQTTGPVQCNHASAHIYEGRPAGCMSDSEERPSVCGFKSGLLGSGAEGPLETITDESNPCQEYDAFLCVPTPKRYRCGKCINDDDIDDDDVGDVFTIECKKSVAPVTRTCVGNPPTTVIGRTAC